MAIQSQKQSSVNALSLTLGGGSNISTSASRIDDNDLQEATNVYYPHGKSTLQTRHGIKALTYAPVGKGTISYIQPIADCPDMMWRIIGVSDWMDVGESVQVVPGEYQIEFTGGAACTIKDVYTLTVYNNGKVVYSIVPPHEAHHRWKIRWDLPNATQGNCCQIEATRDFVGLDGFQVKAGTLGGYIESYDNMTQDGGCWVMDTSIVFGDARVSGNALVMEGSSIHGEASIKENARVADVEMWGTATVEGHAQVYGDCQVFGGSTISGNALVHSGCHVFDVDGMNPLITDNATVILNCRVFGEVIISGSATVRNNCQIYDNVTVTGEAQINDDCNVYNGVIVSEKASIHSSTVFEDCTISDNASIYGAIVGTHIIMKDNANVLRKDIRNSCILSGNTYVTDCNVSESIIGGDSSITSSTVNYSTITSATVDNNSVVQDSVLNGPGILLNYGNVIESTLNGDCKLYGDSEKSAMAYQSILNGPGMVVQKANVVGQVLTGPMTITEDIEP